LHAMSDLEALRTPEEYATYISGLDARTSELDQQFEGRAFDDAGRSEWADIAEIKTRAEATRIELLARRKTVEQLAQVERSEPRPAFNVPNVRNSSQSHVPENPYDIAGYRIKTHSEEQYGQALRDGAMMVTERLSFAHPTVRQDAAREGVERLVRSNAVRTPDGISQGEKFSRQLLIQDNPVYARAIGKYMGSGLNANFTSEERAALAMGTTTTGGYLVNASFDPTIIAAGAWTSINAVRATSRVEQIVGTNVWHGLTATAVTATRADEAAATTEQAPTLGQPSITPTKVQGQITFSIETGEDRPDLDTELAVLIQEALDTEEENSFTVGVGDALGSNTNPTGVLAAHATSGAYAHIATAADGTLAAADLDSTYAGLALRHRARSIWLMSRSVLGAVQALETTGGRLFGSQAGYPAVGQQIPTARTGDTGLRLLGSPVYEAPSGPTAADGVNKVLMCLYDPQTFCIVDRVGTSVEYIPFIFGAAQGNLVTGQRGLYFHKRSSAKPLITTGGLQLAHQA
jgi:HK97 family phage major capsid protein